MVEKKQIVYDLRFNYNGPLSIEAFYAEVEKWAVEKGLEKEIKRKTENLQKSGKKVEWRVEFWKSFDDSHKETIVLIALFDQVKERTVKKNGKSMKINYSDALLTIDGWLETSLTGRWTQAPLYSFFRRLFDKYVWMVIEKYDDPITEDCYDLHKRIKSFLNLYKMQVG